jgi:hypothetical protein
VSNTIVVDGQASDLLVTEGYGTSTQQPVDPTTGPGAVNTDVVAQNLALFITQFRQLKEI